MRRVLVILAALSLLMVVALAPAASAKGNGELMASFQAGLSGGSAIVFNSGVSDSVASPQVNPEGRLAPFGGTEFICDELVVGTWVFVLDQDRDALDAWTNEFKLDSVVLDTTRTPLKRVAKGDFKGWWWFAEGVPVLGTLDPGLHEIEYTFDDGSGPVTWVPTTFVDVDSAHC
jgi:hypothetical protein